MKRSISLIVGPRIGALLFAILTLTASTVSTAAVYVSVEIAPPLLPVYEQPLVPGPGYIWTPGYWAWGPDGYYWVPGTWVLSPFVGALWTPGYWGWSDSLYFWHSGYWGRHVGFYGGINYGFGYTGFGYQGGYWDRGSFWYNRTVNNVNVTNITNTYNTTVVNNTSVTRTSFNGGSGGVIAQPTPQDRIAARETHTPLLPVQARHELAASSNRALLASVNNGHPAIAATPRPAQFAAGAAPARSFSQQASAQPRSVPQRNNGPVPNPRFNNEPRLDRRNAPVNAAAPQFQRAPRSQSQVRAQSEMHPQGSPPVQMRRESSRAAQIHPQGPPQPQMNREGPPQAQMRSQGPGRPQPQMQPQGVPPQQGRPQREARGQHRDAKDGPDERQHQ